MLTVVLAILAGASVAKLLVAGILPGLLLAALYIAYAYVRVLLDPSKAPPLDTPSIAPSATVCAASPA